MESVGLAGAVREVQLALVHHFSVDQDEGPWQGHSRSRKDTGPARLQQFCGLFTSPSIPITRACSLPRIRLCCGTWVPGIRALLGACAPGQLSQGHPSVVFAEPGGAGLVSWALASEG